jgi:putative transposase
MTIAKYKSNLNVVHASKYHVVWCPKYRQKVLTEEIQAHLKVLAEILASETMPDHVHLLVQVDPQFGIAKLVREIK